MGSDYQATQPLVQNLLAGFACCPSLFLTWKRILSLICFLNDHQFLFTSQCSGKISFYTLPPATHTLPTHLSAEIVKEMTEVFDIEDTEQANEDTMECK